MRMRTTQLPGIASRTRYLAVHAMPVLHLPVDIRFKEGSALPSSSEIKTLLQGRLSQLLGAGEWSCFEQELDGGGFVLVLIRKDG